MGQVKRHNNDNTFRNTFGNKLLLLGGSVLFTLLVLEVVFRVFGIRGEYRQPRVDQAVPISGMEVERKPYGFFSNSIWVSTYESDPRGYFDEGNTISHYHNSRGWRDKEHRLEKPSGVFRILGLGDSYLWGQGVKHDDICLSRLPELLDGQLPNHEIETINAGLSFFNTVDQRNQLQEQGLQYDPDLVIVHFVLNDVEHDLLREGPKVEFHKDYLNVYQNKDRLSEFSHAWSWVRYRFNRNFQARRYVQECVDSFREDSPGWIASREAMLDIKRICKKNRIGVCVVIFPFYCELDGDYPFQPIHSAVKKHCQSNEIPVLDLRDSYRQFHGPELWVHPTDQHPNENAHKIAADAIARFLKEDADHLLKVDRGANDSNGENSPPHDGG